MMQVLVACLIGWLVTAIALGVRARGYKTFCEHTSEVVERARRGDLGARVTPLGRGVELGVARRMNEMFAAFEERMTRLSEERAVLYHILNGMTTGVVYIGPSGEVKIMNPAAERLFRSRDRDWEGKKHWEVFRNYRLSAAVDEVLLFGSPWQAELRLSDELVVGCRVNRLGEEAGQTSDLRFDPHVLVLCDDVTARYRLERMRRDFIANVSHELKTPITAILGFSETLAAGDPLDEDVRISFAQVIHEESLRMGRLVDDLLTLSKLESQDIHLDGRPVSLRPLVLRAVRRLRDDLRKRQLTLRVESFNDAKVFGDEDRLLQVLLNLLTNAVHYTPLGGEVSLWWEVWPNEVKVHVKDTGIGIAEDDQPRVFERFYRVDPARTRNSGGTGLGLAIVKHIVNGYGGKVGVTSQLG